MKKIVLASLILVISFSASAQTKKKTPVKKSTVAAKPSAKPVFRNNLDSASYALGLSIGQNLQSNGVNAINQELFLKAIKDVFANQPAAFDINKAQESINNFFLNINKQKYAGALKEGSDFFAKNKLKPGVKTTASGLQYEIITAGNGPKPTADQTFIAHYTGTLLNGTKFDSSVDRGEPLTMPVRDVIKGWQEGLQLMSTGAKYRFYIPYQLGYGASGSGPKIPPYSALIFDLELIGIQ